LIEVSVTVPLFHAKHIAWLCFEGLARQQEVNFEWELIVAEEAKYAPFGKKAIMEYAQRLAKVGCAEIRYFSFKKWVPLADKRRFLINKCTSTSKLIMGNAGDYFSPPGRLRLMHDLYLQHPEADWFVMNSVLLHDILTHKTLYRNPNIIRKVSDISGLAVKASTLRKAAPMIRKRRKSVDSMIYNACRTVVGKSFTVIRDKSSAWKYGITTSGLNSISSRKKFFTAPFKGRTVYKRKLSKTIPLGILSRLHKWMWGLPAKRKKRGRRRKHR